LRKPIIGITASYDHEKNIYFSPGEYIQAIESAGGFPLQLLPLGTDKIAAYLELIDGLLLTGGPDVDPVYYDEDPHPEVGKLSPERDVVEIPLTQEALSAGLPIFAICRGMQVLNIAAGGSLIQDICKNGNAAIKHTQQAPRWYGTHSIQIKEGSILFEILAEKEIRVNSFHHQALKEIPANCYISSHSQDGIIEGIEFKGLTNVLGVQWHPECMYAKDPHSRELFSWFVEQAKNPPIKR